MQYETSGRGGQNTLKSKVVNFILGALLGIVVSWVTNCALAEISLNSFFALYFGILFAAVGVIILIRVLRKGAASSAMRNMLLSFSALVIVSGIMCILLDENWFEFSPPTKVPMFTVVGTSVCFAFVFSLLDLVNFAMTYFRSRPLIENHTQIYVLLVSSCIMGAMYGFIFGIMDVEDRRGVELRDTLILEEEYCIPIGIGIGGLAGIGTQILGDQSQYSGYNGLHQFHHNDDI